MPRKSQRGIQHEQKVNAEFKRFTRISVREERAEMFLVVTIRIHTLFMVKVLKLLENMLA